MHECPINTCIIKLNSASVSVRFCGTSNSSFRGHLSCLFLTNAWTHTWTFTKTSWKQWIPFSFKQGATTQSQKKPCCCKTLNLKWWVDPVTTHTAAPELLSNYFVLPLCRKKNLFVEGKKNRFGRTYLIHFIQAYNLISVSYTQYCAKVLRCPSFLYILLEKWKMHAVINWNINHFSNTVYWANRTFSVLMSFKVNTIL